MLPDSTVHVTKPSDRITGRIPSLPLHSSPCPLLPLSTLSHSKSPLPKLHTPRSPPLLSILSVFAQSAFKVNRCDFGEGLKFHISAELRLTTCSRLTSCEEIRHWQPCPWFITCKRRSGAVVRTTCCPYGEGPILYLSRAETTEQINTKCWMIDYFGEIQRIAKFGCNRC